MNVVDVILAVTTAFFIIILFNTINQESSMATYKIDEYQNMVEVTDKVFEAVLSTGSPEYWYVDPSSADYIGILIENYGYEVDSDKLANMSSLCTSDESLLKSKLFVPDDYNVYISVDKILTTGTVEVCSSPSSATNKFIRETFVDYDGDIAFLKVVVWK